MRKVIAGAFMSLDGVMQSPGGPQEDPTRGFSLGGWSTTYWDALMGEAMGDAMSVDFDLLLGRKTYEIFAGHWPYMPSDDPVASKFNRISKHVVTSSTDPLAWENSYALNGDAGHAVADLKATDGSDLLIQGSTALYPALLENRLIDRFFVMIFPVVIGSGKRLFADGVRPGALTLIDSKTSTTGVIVATYEPAGDVPLGSFQRDDLSEREVARRERMKRED